MIDALTVQRATSSDATALAEVADRTFGDAFAVDNDPADMPAYTQEMFSPERIRAELANLDTVFFLAARPGQSPQGYAKLRAGAIPPCVKGSTPIELERIYVNQSAIGQGVGAKLMEACVNAAREMGYRTLWLGVWEHTERAIGFYERWDCAIVGSKVFQLGSDAQTDLVMVRPL